MAGHISHDQQVAVALIGPEGATGASVFLGDHQSPHSTTMLCDGAAQRMPIEAVHKMMGQRPQVRGMLLRYCSAFYNQAAHTALSNTLSLIEQRVARWLLMAKDRMPGNTIPFTHELVAELLGMRRAGVTGVLDQLEQRGLIRLERGATVILDRKAIEEIAGGYYGLPEKEYARLIGNYWPSTKAR